VFSQFIKGVFILIFYELYRDSHSDRYRVDLILMVAVLVCIFRDCLWNRVVIQSVEIGAELLFAELRLRNRLILEGTVYMYSLLLLYSEIFLLGDLM
jgi:hypothetical protein